MRISVKGKKYDVHVNRIVIILTMGYFLGIRSPEIEKNIITLIPTPSIVIPSPKPLVKKKSEKTSKKKIKSIEQEIKVPPKFIEDVGYLTETPTEIPKVMPKTKELVIKEESIRKKIFSESVIDGNITYLQSQIKFRGRYNLYITSIPFNLVGHFYKENGYVHFKIDSLSKSGKPYSQKIPEVQKKLMNLFKDDGYSLIKIMDGSKMLYDQSI